MRFASQTTLPSVRAAFPRMSGEFLVGAASPAQVLFRVGAASPPRSSCPRQGGLFGKGVTPGRDRGIDSIE